MDITKLIEKGEDALKKKNWDYAISIFLEAVTFDPNHRKARESLRKAELRKYEASYPSAFVRLFTTLGARVGLFFASMGRKKHPERFMLACERYLTKHPKSLEVNVALGDAAEAAGHLDAAVVAFEFAAEHHPQNTMVLKRLGNVLLKKREIRRAHEVFDKAVQIDPNDQEAVKARKNVAAEASLKETGFETAKSSRELVRDKEAAARIEAETRLFRTGDDLESERSTLEKRLQAEPENVDLMADLAETLEKLKRYDDAIQLLERAIAKRPSDTSLQFKRGDLAMIRVENEVARLEQSGNGAAAQAKRRELLELRAREFGARVKAYPTDMNLRFKLGEVLLQLGELDAAIAEFQHTVRDPKYKSESQLRMGRAFAEKGQLDLAVSQFQKALEGQAGMTERVKEIRYALGDVYARQGDVERARREFAAIYEVDINFRDVGQRIAKLAPAPGSGKGGGSLSLAD